MLISFLGGPDESSLSEGVGQKRNSGLRPRDSLIIIALQGPRGKRKGMWRTQCGKSHGERGILAMAPPARRREKARTAWLIPPASGKGKKIYNRPQLPILHPIRAEPLNHIAYLTHKYFCSYKIL